MAEKARRRWYQFNLQTLLLLVAVLAFCFGWLWPQIAWIKERHRAIRYSGVALEGRTSAPCSLLVLGEYGIERVTITTLRSEIDGFAGLVEGREHQLQTLFPEAKIVSVVVEQDDSAREYLRKRRELYRAKQQASQASP